MPDKITLDEALKPKPAAQGAASITFDEAVASRDSQSQPLHDPATGQAVPITTPSLLGPGGEDVVEGNRWMRKPALKSPEESNFGTAVLANIPEDPETRLNIVAKHLFPNDPEARKRVGFVDGVPAYVDDAGQLRRLSGKLSGFLASTVANTPEIAGSIAGSFATGNPVSGAALGAAGGHAVKRGASQLLFDEPATPLSVGKEMAGEAVLNLVTGGIAKGAVKYTDRGKIIDFSPTRAGEAEQVRQYVKQSTGIDLDLAQASGNAKLIALRNYAARYPGKTAEIVQAANESANGQFDKATQRVLDLVAKAAPSEFLGQRGVNAATLAIKTAREQVYHEVRPMYKAAYEAVPEVNQAMSGGTQILDYLKLPYFQEAFWSGQKLRSLETGSALKPKERTVENLIKRDAEAGTYESATTTVESTPTGAKRIISKLGSGETRSTPEGLYTKRTTTTHSDITRPSLAELDYTKRALDDIIDGMRSGAKPQRQRAAALEKKRNEFVAALDALPNQEWQAARRRYGELIQQNVMPLEEGPVGVLARVEYSNNAIAAAKVLSDPAITPDQIAMTKAVLSRQDPEAYNGLVRQWLAQQYNRSLKETQTGVVTNAAGKFRQAVYGTPDAKARAAALMPKEAAQAFDDVMLAAQKLSSTPMRGSDTASNQLITEELRNRASSKLTWLLSPVRTAREAAMNAAEKRAMDQGIESLTEALLDPAKRGQLRQIVKMKDSTKQLIQLSAILGGQVGAGAVSLEADQYPASLQQAMPPMAPQ